MLLGAGLHGEQLSRASGRGQVARTHACLGESCHLSSLSAAGPELGRIPAEGALAGVGRVQGARARQCIEHKHCSTVDE